MWTGLTGTHFEELKGRPVKSGAYWPKMSGLLGFHFVIGDMGISHYGENPRVPCTGSFSRTGLTTRSRIESPPVRIPHGKMRLSCSVIGHSVASQLRRDRVSAPAIVACSLPTPGVGLPHDREAIGQSPAVRTPLRDVKP